MKAINFSRLKGFTLVELLVVIAIIALLMGILMPALSRVRAQGKATVCRANLKQWGSVFLMYTGDNDGKFHPGYIGKESKWWMEVTKEYYADNRDLLYCPMATKDNDTTNVYGGKYEAWGDWHGYYGSLGLNLWVCNPGPDITGVGAYNKPPRYCWRTTNVRRSSEIPLMLDSLAFGGLPLNAKDEPLAKVVTETETSLGNSKISGTGYFCINRHFGFVNCVFLDFSVRQVALKQLWRLRWHREFDTNEDYPVWPEWMKGLQGD
ncbi:MAG TPA: type II secretion system protein [Sedimentisphaerales bacterium]|nr:type II secretion system protein [Sedimentisphaerales bacterium]